MNKLLILLITGLVSVSTMAQTPTYAPLSPAPSNLTAMPNTLPSSGGNTTLTAQAYFATSCKGALSVTAGCAQPVSPWNGLTACSGGQNAVGQTYCNVNSQILLPANTTTSTCSYAFQVACTNGTATTNSQAAYVSVAATGTSPSSTGFGTVPAQCSNLASTGLTWQRTVKMWWLPYLSPVLISDATNYKNIYGATNNLPDWPYAASGSKPTVAINRNNYLAMGFVVPSNASGTGVRYFNVGSGSQLISATISECPGDFGQTGTHIVNQYCKSDLYGGGVQTWTGPATLGTCPLVVGRTYYLNFLSAQLATPTTSTCAGTCNAQIEITH